MADFTLVEPKGWEYDLHSVYSAYLGYFQVYNIAWYERSWGHLFESFEAFLAFSWPVITVTDATTGRAHIVTRLNSLGAFLKMIKTRFGETLIQAPNILQVTPFETASRHLRHVADYASYKKLYSTLPAVVLSATKARVSKAGEPRAVRRVWEGRDKTYLSMEFEWNERNERTVLEWGYAAVRCAHLEALGQWPPIPDTNYRKGHYIVADYVDKITNKHRPNYPWQYAFGDSQVVPKAKLPQIIQAVISLASPDTETAPNTLVLVGHNLQGGVLARLEEMKIKLPHNMLTIDTMVYERALYAGGHRGVMPDFMSPRSDKARISGSSLSFENLLLSLTIPSAAASANANANEPGVSLGSGSGSGSGSSGDRERERERERDRDRERGRDKSSPARRTPTPPHQQAASHTPLVLPQYAPHNAGNDAMMCLFALQRLLDPAGTLAPTVKSGKASKATKVGGGGGHRSSTGAALGMMMPMSTVVPVPMVPVPMAPMAPMMNMPMSMPMMNMGMNMNMNNMGMGGMNVPFPHGTGSGTPSPRPSKTQTQTQTQNQTQTRSRPTTVYDLAGEFGQMQMQLAAGAGSRVPTPGSYGFSATSLRPPVGSSTKRMHSFPNPKIEALE